MKIHALRLLAVILLLIIPTISVHANPGLKCPTDAKGGKRAKVKTISIRKKLIKTKHSSVTRPQNQEPRTKTKQVKPVKEPKIKPEKAVKEPKVKQIKPEKEKSSFHLNNPFKKQRVRDVYSVNKHMSHHGGHRSKGKRKVLSTF